MRVFVCYTSKDPAVTKEKLERVDMMIKAFSKCFIDLLHNKKGRQWWVNYELCRSDVILQIVSPDYPSEWVQKELIFARKKGKPVVKIDIDELLEMEPELLYLQLSELEKKGWSVWVILILSLLACVSISLLGIWLSYLFVSSQVASEVDGGTLNARGLFGDSWGGVNAIISAFAFAGVIVTLFLQNRDLNLQRKEMTRQREEFEKENKTLKYQRFENLFYNMLHLQQEIVSGLKFDYTEQEDVLVAVGGGHIRDKRNVNRMVTGRDVFRYTFDEVELNISEKDKFGQDVLVKGYRQYMNKEGLMAYDSTWIPTYYDHYFRHLYKIIQFVDSQGFVFEEAYKYVSLLRGTLSRYELVWIYYNALNPSFVNFKKLIEKYSLLKNIREDLLTRCAETERYYNGLQLTFNDLKNNRFFGCDFDYYLTDDEADPTKYHWMAFWKRDDAEEAIDYINSRNRFINDAAKKVVK